eukprot:CAMPEP_0197920658 /NCGR_PEP_ID=MMETSP1439-20131203/89369_1 /TAXON_ID=66791 /ORGANISM="Gonyaulax spinifera, Strain CCMP409" /LENGTH=175 /DNA_ID=CAMNT_0043542869 /DNA_START=44 /DNA_END=568 /DNA_ORIENTATION=+
MTDEELAMLLQRQEMEEAQAPAARPPVHPEDELPPFSDEELARMLAQEEEEERRPSAPRPPSPRRTATLVSGSLTTSLAGLAGSSALMGCCGGLQIAGCLGCGHLVTWLCALGGAVAGHMSNNSAPAPRFRMAHVEEEDDDDFYPEDSDDEVLRGLDHSTIEGHTVGHVYSAPSS